MGTNKKELEMLECPFCKGEAQVIKSLRITAPDGGPGYLPYCTSCGVHPSYGFFTMKEAADFWNNRQQKE